ncbi:MAG: BrnT family toxin [Nitrospirae bacterium]|nr:BrnT family toxin [Nitrospirota bacterium]
MFIIDGIIWLDTIVEKLTWKHKVFPYEVEEVLTGKCRIFKEKSGNIEGENLYNALGRTKTGRYLSVFFIRKLDRKALIVTARDMNKRERKRYEEK